MTNYYYFSSWNFPEGIIIEIPEKEIEQIEQADGDTITLYDDGEIRVFGDCAEKEIDVAYTIAERFTLYVDDVKRIMCETCCAFDDEYEDLIDEDGEE